MPPNRAYRCEYLKTSVTMKLHGGLPAGPKEKAFMTASQCLGGR